MKNLKFMLVALFMVSMSTVVRAESSATAYDQKYYSQQVFVVSYNSGPSISRDNVVILDASQAINPNLYLGSYVTTTSTTDSVFVFGVSDESILSGSLGRICVRGPHKALALVPNSSVANFITSGAIITASNQLGKFGYGSTTDGTASGRLGYILSGTATTDTGDAANTYWVWVSPSAHK